ncbi:hypothetical protein SLEP1_g38854 [Rubroshorea leprosula]|uniref:Uncharacterized protein n=1 Tax=Rubroshorea leprosula TaxID=152421 RepID=A0AAV5KZE6_9ROSI|nr:hypothetical protein SLEP1_g38854 [Rubroshorea leprosula]
MAQPQPQCHNTTKEKINRQLHHGCSSPSPVPHTSSCSSTDMPLRGWCPE